MKPAVGLALAILALWHNAGCVKSVPGPVVPPTSAVVEIEIAEGTPELGTGRIITDRQVIERALSFVQNNLTEWYQPRGTFPTPEISVSFKDQDGRIIYILWFGPDWIGADDDKDSYPSLARVKADDVAELKALLPVKEGTSTSRIRPEFRGKRKTA